MVAEAALYFHITGCIFFITAVFIIGRDELMRIIFIIIYLCRFKTHLVDTDLFTQFFYILYLVLIWFYNEELEKNEWCFAFHFFLPFYNIACAFQHFLQLATDTVLLVYILR